MSNLNNFKSKVDKSDIWKLETTPTDLIKLSNVVKHDVVKKDVYDANIKNIKDKILDITNLATNTSLNAKINEVKGEIPSITNLVTTTAFTAFENEIPSVSNLVKKTDYNTNISEIENKIRNHDHDKYITTSEFNKLTAEKFAARLGQANLACKKCIANFVKKTDFGDKLKIFNKKITSNKTKQLLFENEFK